MIDLTIGLVTGFKYSTHYTDFSGEIFFIQLEPVFYFRLTKNFKGL